MFFFYLCFKAFKTPKVVLIYSEFQSPRLDFTLQFIFEEIFELNWELTYDLDAFKAYKGAKINYSTLEIKNSFSIIPSSLLKEKIINDRAPEKFEWNGLPVFFKNSENGEMPFDIFSLTFYFLSRYEEYISGVKFDIHGRYVVQQSLAFKYNFLEIPLVDVLLIQFQSLLFKQFKQLRINKRSYRYTPTYDIDVLFAHKAKPFWRLIGGSLKDLMSWNFKNIIERYKVIFKGMKDPFDNFDKMIDEADELKLAFINIGDYSAFDKNNNLNHPLVKTKINDLQKRLNLAWHPSYRSNDNKQVLIKEAKCFNDIFNKKAVKSRQHFIRLTFPFTYSDLVDVGVQDDYSMGYHSHIGFRAGTAYPFYFYDLSQEEKTNLRIHPFMFMDGTIFDYMKLSVDQALIRLDRMGKLLKKTGGELIGIWHNSFIANDPDRMKFYKEVKKIL